MTPELLEKLIALAEWTVTKVLFAGPVVRDAQAALAAMRTPITAAALVADGWDPPEIGSYTPEKYETSRGEWVFGVDFSWRKCLWCERDRNVDDEWDSGDEFALPMPANMYDLRELMRLLGGQP